MIEVLAAAVPLESVFLGKLLGMFGVALLFVGFWGTIIAKLGSFLPPEIARALAIQTAVGTPVFVALFVTYFTMAYLLLGSAFLVVGAQASTPREIQMLALRFRCCRWACWRWRWPAPPTPRLGRDRGGAVPAVLALRDGGPRGNVAGDLAASCGDRLAAVVGDDLHHARRAAVPARRAAIGQRPAVLEARESQLT